jgi:UDP-N-acetyl-D-mannosaminuronate dehydrogenase
MNIGIIGQGFVGNAVYNKFKNYYNVLTFDLDKSICNSSFEEINNKCKYIFVCLPTPNISLAKSTLDWSPVIDLDTGLKKTINSFKQ